MKKTMKINYFEIENVDFDYFEDEDEKYVFLNQLTDELEITIQDKCEDDNIIRIGKFNGPIDLESFREFVFKKLVCHYCSRQNLLKCSNCIEQWKNPKIVKLIPDKFIDPNLSFISPYEYTANQLKEMHRVVLENAESIERYNCRACKYFSFYPFTETRSMTEEEIQEFEDEKKRKRRIYNKHYRIRKRLTHDYEHYTDSIRKDLSDNLEYVRKVLEERPEKLIVYDLETTGLDPVYHRMVQMAIIDGNGNVLFKSYFNPDESCEWTQGAISVNGIEPETVKNAPTIREKKREIQKILDNAEIITGYNNQNFDDAFLYSENFKLPSNNIDVMKTFAPIYGVFNYTYWNYYWQKLKTACEFYAIKMDKEHDATSDARATLEVLKKIIDDFKKDPEILNKVPDDIEEYHDEYWWESY